MELFSSQLAQHHWYENVKLAEIKVGESTLDPYTVGMT